MAKPRYQPGSAHGFTTGHFLSRRPFAAYLASRLCINDRRTLYLLREGEVTFNGRRIVEDEETEFPAKSRVDVRFPQSWPPYLSPTEMPLDILYEDAAMVVLNKPCGVVVHPARGHLSGHTLQNGLLYRYRNDPEPDKTVAPAHRLDKDTSGVAVFSRTRAAYRNLTRQFATPTPKKTYLVLCAGRAEWDTVSVDQPLGLDPLNLSRSAIVPVSDGGKEALTHFRRLERGRDWSYIEARPVTGRGHQIRLHLAYLGLPVIADADYNPQPAAFPLTRQALHAAQLSITHPTTGEPLHLCAPLPADIATLLAHLQRTHA